MFTKKLISRIVSSLFVFVLMLAQAAPAHAAPGDLDTTFGGSGFVTTPLVVQNYNDAGRSISIQASTETPDAKIVMIGQSYLPGVGNVFTTLRYDRDGSLDTSFDGDGVVTTNVGGSSDEAKSVAVQPDGKIVVAGTVYGPNTGYSYHVGLVRYNSDGSLDASFGGDGIVTTNASAGAYLQIASVAIQPDGKIVAAGYSYATSTPILMVRYNSDGSLDTTFDTDGIVTTIVSTYSHSAQGVAIQPDGKIVVVGTVTWNSPSYYYQFLVLRYNDDGSLDTSFDADGIATTSVGTYSNGTAVAIQADGKIVAAGYGMDNDFAVVRYNSDGSLDTSFSGDGMMTANVSGRDFARSVAIHSDGQIVVAGVTDPSYYGKNKFGVIRLNGGDGSLDTSFDGDGILSTSVLGDNDEANSVMVQSDGKIVVGGLANNLALGETDFALVRYNSDGTLDSAFDGDGKVTTNVSRVQYSTQGYDVAVQSDGKVVMVGGLQRWSGWQFMIARFNSDGSFDTSFDTDGIITLTIPNAGHSQARAVEIQGDGKIVVAGFGQNQMIVIRFNSDGSLDTSFSTDGIVATTAGGDYAQAYALAIQSDGQIVVGGLIYGPPNYKYQFGAIRLNGSDGSLDTSFDADGAVTTSVGGSYDIAYAVAVQSNGDIVLAGNARGSITNDRDHFGLVRYNSDGSLDTSFDTDGIVITSPSGYSNQVKSLAIQDDGQILVAGYGYAPPSYSNNTLVVRYNGSDGSLDTSFDGDGIATPYVGGNTGQAYAMALQSDGQIVLAGYAYGPATNYQSKIGVVRLNKSNGSLDTSFNDDGIAAVAVSGSDTVNALATQPDGKIVVAGHSYFPGTYAVVFMAARLEGGASVPTLLDQTITVNTNAPATALEGTTFTVAASASSGLPVSYSSSGACTNVGADFTMTSGTGTCTVMYDQAGDASYNPAPQVTETVTAESARLDQTITVTIDAPSAAASGTTFTVEAGASSGLPVSYSSSGSCTNVGADFTMNNGTGACTVMYDQAGDENYNPAPQVTQEVAYLNTAPVIDEGDLVTVTMSQDGAPIAFGLTLNASDEDGDAINWSISDPANNGSASIIAKSNCSEKKAPKAPKGPKSPASSLCKTISYVPNAGYSGVDSFEVQVDDSELTDTITVNVIIESTNTSVVRLLDSQGNGLAGATVQYYASGWQTISGSTDADGRLSYEDLGLSGNVTFRITYANASIQKQQNITDDPTVIFQTQLVNVRLLASDGSTELSADAQYYASGWKTFGGGSTPSTMELLPTNYTFRITYGGASVQKAQDVNANADVVFQTELVTMNLLASDGVTELTGTGQYYASGWKTFGGGSTPSTMELLPANYTFRVTYGGASVQKVQDVNVDPLVVFQTKLVTMNLLASDGVTELTGTGQYYASGWKTFGGGSTPSTMELLPANYTFRVTYGGASVQKAQDVNANADVVFQTKLVTMNLLASDGVTELIGTGQYYASGWKTFGGGSTPSTMELLPANYTFRVTYGGASVQKAQDVNADALVVFQTGQVHSNSATATQYYANGWKTFTQNMELLPGSYAFKFNDGTPQTTYTLTAGSVNDIH